MNKARAVHLSLRGYRLARLKLAQKCYITKTLIWTKEISMQITKSMGLGVLLCVTAAILISFQIIWVEFERVPPYSFSYTNLDEFFREWHTDYAPYQQRLELWVSDDDLILENNGTWPWSEGISTVFRKLNIPNVHDWKIEAKVKWINGSYGGHTLWAVTNDFTYLFALNDIDKGYDFSISKTNGIYLKHVLLKFGYSGVKDVWHTFRLEKQDTTFNMYLDNMHVGTYDFAKDQTDLVEIGIGTGWDATSRYDYVFVEYKVKPETGVRYWSSVGLLGVCVVATLNSIYGMRIGQQESGRSRLARLAFFLFFSILATLSLASPFLAALLPSQYHYVIWPIATLTIGIIANSVFSRRA